MQEKEFLIVNLCITQDSYSATLGKLVMSNSYPCDGIFNPHLTTIKGSLTIMLTFSHVVTDKLVKWAAAWQNQQSDCAPSEDSDQPGHLPSLHCVQLVAKDPRFLHADSKDFDQTGQMPRLIWVFAGCSCHFLVPWLKSSLCNVVYTAVKCDVGFNRSDSLHHF